LIRDTYFYKRAVAITGLSQKIKRALIKISTLNFFYELLKIFPPLVFKQIIDYLVKYDPKTGFTPALLISLLLGYAGCLFIMALMDIFLQQLGEHSIRDAEEDVITRTFEKLLLLDLSYHERNNTGTSVNKLIKGQAKLVDLLYNLMNLFLPVIFQIVITAAVLFWLSWEIGLAFLIFVPLFIIIILHGAKQTQKAREEFHVQHDAFAGSVTQSIVNIRTVKDFSNEQKELEKSKVFLKRYFDAVMLRIRIGLRHALIEDLLTTAARVITIVLAVYLMMNGQITAGSLVLIVTLSEKAFLNLTRLRSTYYRMQDTEPSIDRLHEIFNEEIKVKDNPASQLKVAEGKIEFDHVTFKYDGSDANALKDVSFAIEPKQTVAIVGRSGSGKTTMVKLILRLADAQQGRILIDGHATDEYSFKSLRGGMAVVAQDVELFNDTIFSNIAYGTEGATMDDVIAAAKAANAHDFISRLRNGYETVVGERGMKLSGGQKQRIAIARALLRKPRILIFDEATSSLDAESERLIHESIFKLSGKLTLILIAHRFSTIEHADKVILLERGELKEMGTHEELIAKDGIFAKLRKLQELKGQ
jgi:subfamily B ATP-binding cassette protein MsbA